MATQLMIYETAVPVFPAAFNDDRFIGVGHLAPDGSVVPISDHTSVDIGVAEIGGSYSLALGLKSSLHATFGDIEATLPYNITIDTSYNVTTDSLLIDPSAALDPRPLLDPRAGRILQPRFRV